MFNDSAKAFIDKWSEVRREVTAKSGRKALAGTWWDQIEDSNVTFEQLAPKRKWLTCDAKILRALLKIVTGLIEKKIRAKQKEMHRNKQMLYSATLLRRSVASGAQCATVTAIVEWATLARRLAQLS